MKIVVIAWKKDKEPSAYDIIHNRIDDAERGALSKLGFVNRNESAGCDRNSNIVAPRVYEQANTGNVIDLYEVSLPKDTDRSSCSQEIKAILEKINPDSSKVNALIIAGEIVVNIAHQLLRDYCKSNTNGCLSKIPILILYSYTPVVDIKNVFYFWLPIPTIARKVANDIAERLRAETGSASKKKKIGIVLNKDPLQCARGSYDLTAWVVFSGVLKALGYEDVVSVYPDTRERPDVQVQRLRQRLSACDVVFNAGYSDLILDGILNIACQDNSKLIYSCNSICTISEDRCDNIKSNIYYYDFLPKLKDEIGERSGFSWENAFYSLFYEAVSMLVNKFTGGRGKDLLLALRRMRYYTTQGGDVLSFTEDRQLLMPITCCGLKDGNKSNPAERDFHYSVDLFSDELRDIEKNPASISDEKLGLIERGIEISACEASVTAIRMQYDADEVVLLLNRERKLNKKSLVQVGVGRREGKEQLGDFDTPDFFKNLLMLSVKDGDRDVLQICSADDAENNNANRLFYGCGSVKEQNVVLPINCYPKPHVDSYIVAKTYVEALREEDDAKTDDFCGAFLNDARFQVALEAMLKQGSYCYVAPSVFKIKGDQGVEETFVRGGIILVGKHRLPYLSNRSLLIWATSILSPIVNQLRERSLKVAQVASAIGSIMSRNGSHNIGSHVLAALSHNVGTMPDDRVLYQYIQQRMDYIAIVTTEALVWRQPTLFVGEIVKMFLSQRHLLDYIARSEGLSAYQFQNPSVSSDAEQPKTIQLHVRRLKAEAFSIQTKGDVVYKHVRDQVEANFILYPGDEGFVADGKWNAHLERDIEVAIPGGEVGQHALFTILENVIRNAAKHSWSKREDFQKEHEHLDVFVDFCDKPEGCVVEFLVWTKERLTEDALIEGLTKKMSGKFISEDGRLIRENWGFAEMRIAAGYLNGAKIDTIGGLDGEDACLRLIRPVCVCPEEGMNCLGYRFDIPKPKELLILLDESLGTEWDDAIIQLRQYGVTIMSKKQAKKEISLPYSFVLLQNFDACADYATKLPFRVVVEGEVKNLTNENLADNKQIGLFPHANGILAPLKDIPPVDLKDWAAAMLDKIYYCWACHIKEIAKSTKRLPQSEGWRLPVVIDVAEEGSGKKGGKGLVGRPELLRFVFEHSFNAALRSYLAQGNEDAVTATALGYLLNMKPRPILSLEALTSNGKDVQSMVARQVNAWCASASDWPVVRWLYSDKGVMSPALEGFANFLDKIILEQADSFLAKYEERISSLPKSFGSRDETEVCVDPVEWGDAFKVQFSNDDKIKESYGKEAIAYWRHKEFFKPDLERIKKEPAYRRLVESQEKIYFEPLSGSQSYLNSLISYGIQLRTEKNSGHRLLTSLIECALQRVLIIDERVKKFAQEHLDVGLTFGHVGLSVCDDTDSEVKKVFASFNKDKGRRARLSAKSPLCNNEIVVIHMGVIDKLLSRHEDKNRVEDFIQYLKRSLRYVVVTTGRGMPSNLPDSARVLPFSVVESTVFKKYPEKMILVDTIMNVLPARQEVRR